MAQDNSEHCTSWHTLFREKSPGTNRHTAGIAARCRRSQRSASGGPGPGGGARTTRTVPGKTRAGGRQSGLICLPFILDTEHGACRGRPVVPDVEHKESLRPMLSAPLRPLLPSTDAEKTFSPCKQSQFTFAVLNYRHQVSHCHKQMVAWLLLSCW